MRKGTMQTAAGAAEGEFLTMEFHISRKARDRYGFAESLFSYNGNVILANLPACREFAHRMNQVRDVQKNPEQAVHAGSTLRHGPH